MPVQATRVVVPLQTKEAIVFTTPVTALVPAPGPNSISVVTLLAAADQHRKLEIIQRVHELLNHLLEKNYFNDTSTDIFVAMKIFEAKAVIRNSTVFTEIVTGDLAITVDALLRDPGAKNWITNAIEQTLDRMRELDRLAV